MAYSIRTAQNSDLSLVAALVNSAYRGDYSKIGWTTEADLLDGQRTDPDSLRELISLEDQSLHLLHEDEKLIGCVLIKEEETSLYFGMLTVEPALQGKGLAKLLLRHVDAMARELGKKTIRLTVIDRRRELIAYYERLGFRFTGQTEPFPEHDPRFGIPKQKLRFLVYQKSL